MLDPALRRVLRSKVVPNFKDRTKGVPASSGFDIRERLKELGLKEKDFASLIGRDPSTLRKWATKNPSAPKEIERLLDLLGVFLRGEPEPEWLEDFEP